MLNQAAVEALYSASYVEDYLDCVENLPDDVQRHFTQLREYDQKYQDVLHELSQYQDVLEKDVDAVGRKRVLLQIQRALIRAQELGDEKIEVMNNVQDLVENKSKQLETDYKNLDFGRENENMDNNRSETQPERCSKRSRRQRNQDLLGKDDTIYDRQEKEVSLFGGNTLISSASGSNSNTGIATSLVHYGNASASNKKKKKKRKTKGDKGRDSSPIDPPIDPNEPTYCLCVQVSYGEMIGCDNEECPIEWFHFSCVGLTTKPKGKWFCPKCRGDRSNQMKQR